MKDTLKEEFKVDFKLKLKRKYVSIIWQNCRSPTKKLLTSCIWRNCAKCKNAQKKTEAMQIKNRAKCQSTWMKRFVLQATNVSKRKGLIALVLLARCEQNKHAYQWQYVSLHSNKNARGVRLWHMLQPDMVIQSQILYLSQVTVNEWGYGM